MTEAAEETTFGGSRVMQIEPLSLSLSLSLSDCVTFAPNLDIFVVIHQKCFHSAPLCSHLVHRITGCDDFTDDGGSSLSLSFLTFLSSASLSLPSLRLF